MTGFAEAISEILGIDLSKERVIAIDISVRPLEFVTVTIQRILPDDLNRKVVEVLRGVSWEQMVKEDGLSQ